MNETEPASLGLSPAEWQVLCSLLGVSLRPPGPWHHAPAAERADADRSLRTRNVISADGLRVAAPVAALLFSLAHPETSVWARPHGSPRHTVNVALNRRVSAVAWLGPDSVRLAHTSPLRVGGDLARLVVPGVVQPPIHGSFSLSGGLWHDLLTQATVASDRALESLAGAEGVDQSRLPLVAGLARAATNRVDLLCTRRGGAGAWSGGEVSLLRADGSVWTVKDGRAFDSTGRRASSRAVFTNVDPVELLHRLTTS
ncbi:MAG: hypothetical protein RJA47_801 [Actinomycetota bacterium]|jgi:hypothetical protein